MSPYVFDSTLRATVESAPTQFESLTLLLGAFPAGTMTVKALLGGIQRGTATMPVPTINENVTPRRFAFADVSAWSALQAVQADDLVFATNAGVDVFKLPGATFQAPWPIDSKPYLKNLIVQADASKPVGSGGVVTPESMLTSWQIFGPGLTVFGFDVERGVAAPTRRVQIYQSGVRLPAQSTPVAWWPDGTVLRYLVTVNALTSADLLPVLADTEYNPGTDITSATLASSGRIPSFVVRAYNTTGLASAGAHNTVTATYTCTLTQADLDASTDKSIGKLRSHWWVWKAIATTGAHTHLMLRVSIEAFSDHVEIRGDLCNTGLSFNASVKYASVIVEVDTMFGATNAKTSPKKLCGHGVMAALTFDEVVFPVAIPRARLSKGNMAYRIACGAFPRIQVGVPSSVRKTTIATLIDVAVAEPQRLVLSHAIASYPAGLFVGYQGASAEFEERAPVISYDLVGLNADDESLQRKLIQNCAFEGEFFYHRHDVATGMPPTSAAYYEPQGPANTPAGDRWENFVVATGPNVLGAVRIPASALEQYNGAAWEAVPDAVARLYARFTNVEGLQAHGVAYAYPWAVHTGREYYADKVAQMAHWQRYLRDPAIRGSGGLLLPISSTTGELRQLAWMTRNQVVHALTARTLAESGAAWARAGETALTYPGLEEPITGFGPVASNPLRVAKWLGEVDPINEAAYPGVRGSDNFQHHYLASVLTWAAKLWGERFESVFLAAIEWPRLVMSSATWKQFYGTYGYRIRKLDGNWITSLADPEMAFGPLSNTTLTGKRISFDPAVWANGHLHYVGQAVRGMVDRKVPGYATIAALYDEALTDTINVDPGNNKAGNQHSVADYPAWTSRLTVASDRVKRTLVAAAAMNVSVGGAVDVLVTSKDALGLPVVGVTLFPLTSDFTVASAQVLSPTDGTGRTLVRITGVAPGSAKVAAYVGAAQASIIDVTVN
jgi:hypothetical protein